VAPTLLALNPIAARAVSVPLISLPARTRRPATPLDRAQSQASLPRVDGCAGAVLHHRGCAVLLPGHPESGGKPNILQLHCLRHPCTVARQPQTSHRQWFPCRVPAHDSPVAGPPWRATHQPSSPSVHLTCSEHCVVLRSNVTTSSGSLSCLSSCPGILQVRNPWLASTVHSTTAEA